ncbi:MAG: protein kinase domain-containing protein, partial [Bacteroidota bacterium]
MAAIFRIPLLFSGIWRASLMIGQLVSHYQILEKLGEGGMGVVYKAQDTKLNRQVALKFLPHYLTTDQNEKERFYHEARSASALNHTNITTIYEIDERDEQVFLAMEYVEGRTLKKLVEETEPLSMKKVLEIAIQACDGLAAAHEKGIVHRDIKSDNIMLTPKGQVKIMDFGLAKVKGTTKLTKAGSTVGTAAYMSPEQAQGEEVDHRSDIFSFGVVLYELLTTKLPFRGEHHAALMYSLINEDPQPIARFNNSVTPDLERVAQKALAKNRDERYQHIDDMLADLRRERKNLEYARTGYVRTTTTPQPFEPVSQPVEVIKPVKKYLKYTIGALAAIVIGILLALFNPFSSKVGMDTGVSSERKKVAVLPFENFGASEQEYFADGITEEITSRLSGLSGLGVIARSSAMQYKKTTKTLQEIGSELGVAYVLHGTVRWETTLEGERRVRVNPELIKVSDATQIWSEPFEAAFSSVFKLQAEIAARVANALGVTLLQPEQKILEAKLTDNPEAYDFYLRGVDYQNRSYEKGDMNIAQRMFERAIGLDGRFAFSYARLSRVHSSMYWFYYDRTETRALMAKENAERAIQLNPDVSDVHGAMGWYHYHCKLDYENALREFQLALKYQPNNVDVLLGIGAVQRRQGKVEDALTNFINAVEISPRSSWLVGELAGTYALLRRYSESEHHYDRALLLTPDIALTYAEKSFMHLRAGDVG